MPVPLQIDKWLQDQGKAVPEEALERLLREQIGMPKWQFWRETARIPNAIRTDDGQVIHLSLLGIRQEQMDPLLNYVTKLAEGAEFVSVEDLFAEKAGECRRIGIRGPRMLYALLRHFAAGRLKTQQYPRISRAGRARRGKAAAGAAEL